MLEELSSIDKHRLIHLTAAVGVRSRFGLRGPGFQELRRIEPLPVKVKDRAIAARFYGKFDMEAGVNVEAVVQPDIIFDRRGEASSVRGKSVVRILFSIRDLIGLRVFPSLSTEIERLFPDWTLRTVVEDTGEQISVL
jgi:hypothetical protein